jgi:hypothetical protein
MVRSFSFVFCAFVAVSCQTDVATAQWREGFESPDPIWSLAGADGGVRVLSHKRLFEGAHSGQGVEHVRFVAGRGTYIHYTMPIERSPLIEESGVSLWLRSDRAQMQLMVRVVLPRTLDDRTGKPLTTILRGDTYLEPGLWQQLRVADLPRLMARDLVVLRSQYGPQVDAREAYIDQVQLNAYGGPGETNLWVDDLEVLGVLDPDWARDTEPAATSRPGSDPVRSTAARPLVIDGELMLLEGRPQFVRAIEERGEPWEFLRSIGFNTIWLATSPSAAQQEEAKRLGLWLIAPPPQASDDPEAIARNEQVIAWLVGRQLRATDLNSVRALGSEVRRADRVRRRPLLGGPVADWWSFSKELDLLLLEAPSLFTATEIDHFTHRLQTQRSEARAGLPCWATLSLEASEPLGEQLKLLAPGTPVAPQAAFAQARLAMYAVLRSGVRGLLFRSSSRLDAPDERAAQRQAVLQLLNYELQLCEPWLSGDATPEDLPQSDPTLRATMWQTERARLLLVTRQAPQAQYAMPATRDSGLALSLPGTPSGDRFFQLMVDGVQPLAVPTRSNASRLEIPPAGHAAAVVFTQNSLVIQHLARTAEAQRRPALEARLRLAANQLTSAELVMLSVQGSLPTPPVVPRLLADARALLTQADVLLARGDLTASYRHVQAVEEAVSQLERLWWESARAAWPNSQASPLCVSFQTLPAHALALTTLRERTWGGNALPDGHFESLSALLAAGWKQQRVDSAALSTLVELSRQQPQSGTLSLRLVATPRTSGHIPSSDLPGVRIITPPLQVKAGQMYELRGWAKVPAGAQGELLIYDSLTGEELGERLRGSDQWREFLLLRIAPADGLLQYHFALSQPGEAWLDNLTLRFSDR